MNKSKIVQILNGFSPKEIKEFEKFVVSPYFNTGRNAEGLFNILKEYYPDFESPDLERELVFERLFPGEKFVEKKFKNVTSALTQLADRFLVNERLRNDPVEFEQLLYKEYWERENYKPFLSILNSLEKRIEKLPFDRKNAFLVEEGIASYRYSYYLKLSRPDKAIPFIGESSEYNSLSFLIKFIKSFMLSHTAVITYNTPVKNTLFEVFRNGLDLDKIIAGLRKSKYRYLWLLELYYYTLKTYTDLNDVKSFKKARDIFNKHIDKFSRYEKYFIFNDFYGFCVRQFSRGNTNFLSTEFEICKQQKNENALTISDSASLDLMFFRNFVYTALKAKEYDWLEEFVNDCAIMMPPDGRDSMRDFTLARLEFERGNFDKALEHASNIQYEIFTYKLDVKNLLLLTYYELELFDQAESLIDTYKHYITTMKEFSPAYLKKFKDFIKIYSLLFKARTSGKTQDSDLLLKKAEDIKVLPSRAWFVQKIKELQ